eukprot:Em0005g1347a
MASEDEKVTVYLQKHKIRAIFDDMEAKLVKELPLDPIAFIITKLQAIEKADKKSPAASATITASPKRIAATTPKAVGKSPGTAKPPVASGHSTPSAPAVPKAASSPSTTTTTTPKGISRPATAGSKVPTRPKTTPSPSGATRPATAAPTAAPASKGGRVPASGGVVGGKASGIATAKATRPVSITKPKVGGVKVGGAKEEAVAKVTTKTVAPRVTEEEEENEESYSGGGAGEEDEMGVSGSIAGREGDSSSESDEDDQIYMQDEVQVDQLLDAHRRARLPRKSCPKAKAILELRAVSPSLGYVSDSSEESEAEESRGVKLTEDEVKLSEEGITCPTLGLTAPTVMGSLDGVRSLLCERCAALLPPSNGASPAGRESVSPVAEEHDVTGTEVDVKKEVVLCVQHDRYGWGR